MDVTGAFVFQQYADRQPIRRIAIMRALFLGDMLCSVPGLRAVRRRFPEAEITLIGLPWMSDWIRHVPYVDRLLIFPGYPGIAEVPVDAEHVGAFLQAARAVHYDLVIQMHGDGTVSNGFVRDLQGRVSLGYRCRVDDQRLDLALEFDPGEHEIRRWLRLIALTGAAVDDDRLEWEVQAPEAHRARALLASVELQPGPLVAIHPGAKDPARRWSAKCFAAVADALCETYSASVILTGSEAERPLTAAVQRTMCHPALDLSGITDLPTFAAVLSRADLLLTNDTGASHLAAATGTASVVLFGPTRPERWAPLDQQRHKVVDAVALTGQGDGALALQQLTTAPVLGACRLALRDLGMTLCRMESGSAIAVLGATSG